ncbi:unnamed protein product [Microthlaspi erraticum]|uniref:Uncharacterized protein n=1 Tax=Microthlaspi erraticum TaxID=1685480 RepID=A0A6D2HSA0_9BRAS|nr:unnamed protein product [Microthlaspi erraticum]
MKDGVSFISLLSKRPVSWLSFLAAPLLHIVGLGFSQILITSAALFFSSLFFPLSIQKPNSLIDSKVEDQDLDKQDSSRDMEMSNDEDDGTIPDEESLIELSLPSGHYVGHHFSTMNGRQDFRFIQLSAEFEDDNLIEIDISIGSIKCSGFEIKA